MPRQWKSSTLTVLGAPHLRLLPAAAREERRCAGAVLAGRAGDRAHRWRACATPASRDRSASLPAREDRPAHRKADPGAVSVLRTRLPAASGHTGAVIWPGLAPAACADRPTSVRAIRANIGAVPGADASAFHHRDPCRGARDQTTG